MKKKKENSYIFMKKTPFERVLHAFMFIFLLAISVSYLFPLLWLFVQSFHDKDTYFINIVINGAFSLPKVWHFSNYLEAFKLMKYNDVTFVQMFLNSVWYIIIGETWCMFWPILTGYIFAKYQFRGKAFLYALIIFTLTVPVVGTTGAFYKLIAAFGLYDKGPLFVIATGVGGFTTNFLIFYGIFKGLSWSYAESVFMDGGGNITAFFRVMLPMAMPAISALLVSNFIVLWNDYYQFMMYLPSTPTVATGLYFIRFTIDRLGKPLYYAGLIIAMIPVLVIYAFMAEKMMTNLSIGGLKG